MARRMHKFFAFSAREDERRDREREERQEWRLKARTVYGKKLASKEKTPVSEGLSKIDHPAARKDSQAAA